MRTWIIVWRWPLVRRYCLVRFFLNTRTLRVRISPRTLAWTFTPLSASALVRTPLSPETRITLAPDSARLSPFLSESPEGFSMRTMSPAATFSCLPPVRTMAYIGAANHKGFRGKVKPQWNQGVRGRFSLFVDLVRELVPVVRLVREVPAEHLADALDAADDALREL